MMEFATFLFQGLAAFVGTIAFAVLFHVPRQQYLWAGVTGCLGWLCYLLMNRLTVSTVIASFIATLLLTAVSRFFAVWRRIRLPGACRFRLKKNMYRKKRKIHEIY